MSPRLALIFVLTVALAACGRGADTPTSTGAPQPPAPTTTVSSPQVVEMASPNNTPAGEASRLPTNTPTPPGAAATPTATGEPTFTPSPTAVATDLSISPQDISFYPITAIFEGDLVSIQVKPNLPPGLPPNDVDVRVFIDGLEVVTSNLNYRNLDGEVYGLYQWVWDAAGQIGPHEVTTIVDPDDLIQLGDEDPDNNEAATGFLVRPASILPESVVEATWITADSNCCTAHVITGTAAHRDLKLLLEELDAAFQRAALRLDQPLKDKYHVYFIDRNIGQGGYATDYMVVSYLDRDYGAGELTELLVHEATHLIDRAFAPDRMNILAEGLAVWVAGGHYQQEDLGRKMAGLVEIGRYVPLGELADDFFARQHETSYLEAGAFVSYLVEIYGWPRVRAFYIATTPSDGPTPSSALDTSLQAHFGLTLEQVEEAWLSYLARLPRDRTAADNIRATIRFFEVMRRYQRELDPSAFYLTAWLPPPSQGEEVGATADFSRRPQTPANIALETILHRAGHELLDGRYDLMNALLDSVIRVLSNDGRFLDPLARSYLDIVLALSGMGYEAQSIVVNGDLAQVFATANGEIQLHQFNLALQGEHTWVLAR